MLDPKLLEILACPACRGPVVLDADEQWLYCQACSLKYPVTDGIPIMLSEEAEHYEHDESTGNVEPEAGE